MFRTGNASFNYQAILLGLSAALLPAALFAWHLRVPPSERISSAAVASRQESADAAPARTRSAPAPEAAFRAAADGRVDIPPRFQLPGVAHARSAANLQEWVAQFPPDQQQRILDFDEKHFGVYRVNSPEQVAWMAQNGYPLPEDVIAAEGLTDDDLRELARRGNDKAGFMLRERNIEKTRQKVDAYVAQGRTQADFWTGDPDAQQLAHDDRLTRQIIDQSNSPYKGFVQTQEAALLSEPVGIDSTVIAGLSWARRLGDFRAQQFMAEYVADDPIREAMQAVANAVASNHTRDFTLMQSRGCERIGTPPGMSIPGAFAPVD